MAHSSQVGLNGLTKGSLLESYRIFIEVANSHSMSAAAWNLDIDVSVVSRQVKTVERHYQCKLFERHRHGVKLTSAGERVCSYAAQILADEERLQDDLNELRNNHAGVVRIAAAESAIAGPFADIAVRFAQLYPKIRIEMFQASSEQILSILRRGEAELGAGFDIGNESGIEIVASHIEPVSVVVSPSHPMSGEKRLDIRRLLDYPLATAERNSGIMRVVNRFALRQGVELKPSLVANSLQALTQIAEAGAAITVGSLLSRRRLLREHRLVAIPLDGDPPPQLCLNFCTLKNKQNSFALTKMIDEIKRMENDGEADNRATA